MVGDGGGKAPALAQTVIGADNVARVIAGFGAMTLDVLGGRIQTVRTVVNPDKLGHVGPVADGWALAREVKQARRSVRQGTARTHRQR